MDYSLLVGIHNSSEGNETTYIDGQANTSELEADNEKFTVQSGMSQSSLEYWNLYGPLRTDFLLVNFSSICEGFSKSIFV